MALVCFGVGVMLEISETQAGAVREAPHLLLLVQLGTEPAVDLTAALDRLDQLGALAPDHQANGSVGVSIGMCQPVAEHAVGFAATSGAAIEHFENRAGDQRRLRPGQGLPD